MEKPAKVARTAKEILRPGTEQDTDDDPRRIPRGDGDKRKKRANKGLPMPVVILIAVLLGTAAGLAVYFLIA